MKKINKEGLRSDKGFTMIELIIVIAILGILAAILVPSFTTMTKKSRLKADVSTVRQVQTQLDLFIADHDGKYPAAGSDGVAGKVDASAATLEGIVAGLVEEEYIAKKETVEGNGAVIELQTGKAVLSYVAADEQLKIDFSKADSKVATLAKGLSTKELAWIADTATTTP